MSINTQIQTSKDKSNRLGRRRIQQIEDKSKVQDGAAPNLSALSMDHVLENPIQARPQDVLNAQRKLGNQTVQKAISTTKGDAHSTNQRGELHENITSQIRQAGNSGRQLPRSIQERMSAELSHDFSKVHIHNDSLADQISRRLNAHAFTVGKHVFFQRGAFAPDTRRGRYTLAHELTHVIQQSGAEIGDGPLLLGASNDPMEQQAHQAAKRTQSGVSPAVAASAPIQATSQTANAVQRIDVKAMANLWDDKIANQHDISPPQRPAWERRRSVGNLRDLAQPAPPQPAIPQPAIPQPAPPQPVIPQPAPPQPVIPQPAPPQPAVPQPAPPQPVIPQPAVPQPARPPVPQQPAPRRRIASKPPQPARPRPPRRARSDAHAPQQPAPRRRIASNPPQPAQPRPPRRPRRRAPSDAPQANPQAPNYAAMNLTNKRVGAGVLKEGLFPGEESIVMGADLAGAGLGIASGWVDDKETSGGIGIASNVLQGGAQAWNLGKGIGKVASGYDRDYQRSAAGKQVASSIKKEGAMDIVSNTLNLGSTAGSAAVNISKASGGNDAAEKGGGIASGIFGIGAGLVGGVSSLFGFGSATKSKSRAKQFTGSGDQDIAAIAKLHAQQKGVEQVDTGIEAAKGLGTTIAGAGSIVGALGGTTAGNILYSVGTGMGMLGSIGQKFNKARAPKDTGAAAKGLAERIRKGGNDEADRYAASMGIDLSKIDRNDPYLDELVKIKMGA